MEERNNDIYWILEGGQRERERQKENESERLRDQKKQTGRQAND